MSSTPSHATPAAPAAGAERTWDVALVCLNGHLVNDRARSAPERNAQECRVCLAETIRECPGCREPLLGAATAAVTPPLAGAAGGVEAPASLPQPRTRVPRFCHACGRPLPWTERTLSAARAVIRELSGLEPHVRHQLRRSLDHIIQETPQTPEALRCINRALAALPGDTAATLRALILGVAADAIRPRLFTDAGEGPPA